MTKINLSGLTTRPMPPAASYYLCEPQRRSNAERNDFRASASQRPVVDNGYEREFQYVYGAVSPLEGELDWMICPAVNTDYMATFLAQVSVAHPNDFIVMVVAGASSHVAKALVVPENIRLHRLPGYSPELNPQEHLWDELREKEFPTVCFQTWRESCEPWGLACHGWLQIETECGAFAPGLELLVSS